MTLKERIEEARSLGIKAITIDGVTYDLTPMAVQPQPTELAEEDYKELIKKLTDDSEYTSDEIQFYATPYFDELQAIKEKQKELGEQP